MDNTAKSEIELLKASIQGNTTAFESIVKKYQSLVCAITFSAIPDVEKSEDMAQDTFLRAWNNLSHLKDLHKFRAWLISIARNIINDSLRKQKRDLINKATPIDQIEDKRIRKSELAHEVLIKEQQAVVQNALMEIPEKYREPLVLFYRQEKSVKHIAEQLELSEETVKQHLSRGRKLLRKQVAAMVESTISRTGPTNIFTSAVMVSIIGMAVKSSGAAAAGVAAAATSSTTAGPATVMSGITAKIITAAAVVTLSIGTVVTYKHLAQPNESSPMPVVTSSADDIEKADDSDNISSAVSMDIETAAIQESTQTGNVSAVYTRDENFENTAKSSKGISSNDSTSKTPAITLKAKPNNSPYEYYLFTRVDREQRQDTVRTLVLGHITANGLEFKDIETDTYGRYRWGEPVCVTGGKLYSFKYSELICIDLATKQSERLSSRTSGSKYNIINPSTSTCFADKCLYGLGEMENTKILRLIDFEKAAYRDIVNVNTVLPHNFIAISPDRKRLAYFSSDPNDGIYPSSNKGGYFLTIVDVESGEVTLPAEPIDFLVAAIASSFPGIPIVWIDSETVAFIRTEIQEKERNLFSSGSAVHMLSIVNADIGQMEDIMPLPGNPYMRFAPDLIQDNVGVGPRVCIKHEDQGDYRLDIKTRKLVEDDMLGGDYSISYGHLFYGDKNLGPAERRHLKISPDAKRIIWIQDDQLFYHDDAQENGVQITEAYLSEGVGLWLKQEDLRSRAAGGSLSAEWIAFKDLTSATTTQQWTETRKNVRDYLKCTIKTDKEMYLLHEPVQVTLTLTNISNSDITIMKPVVFESVLRALAGLSLNYPGGQKSIDCGAGPYGPAEQEILLKAGESVSSTDSFEVNAVGNYSLEYRYKRSDLREYIGYITAEPTVFKVATIDDTEKEQQLFEAKFARLMDKFHREIEMDPNWNGNNNTVGDQVTGMPGMGPKLAPYLIVVLENEKHENSRELLFRALSSVAGPEYIPFFKDRLINGEAESVCNWILDTYRNSAGDNDTREQALEALLLGMSHEDVEVRREVCNYLTKIYDQRIESCFQKAVEDEDKEISQDTAYYLAAAEWLELADWLKLATSEPTYTRYISACSIIGVLEKKWNISKGALPSLTKEDFANTDPLPEQYFQVIGDWQSWANNNPRASFLFFEEYREQWWENDSLREK